MKLYHTSPKEITKITKNGAFGESLCFSADVYSMSVGTDFIYSIELEESDVIEASRFFYQDDCDALDSIVEHIMSVVECDKEEAESYLDGSASHEDAEIDWMIQGMMGDAAKLLGYKAAQAQDEQGAVYIVPMFGKESELKAE